MGPAVAVSSALDQKRPLQANPLDPEHKENIPTRHPSPFFVA